jgi:hypothetical protein
VLQAASHDLRNVDANCANALRAETEQLRSEVVNGEQDEVCEEFSSKGCVGETYESRQDMEKAEDGYYSRLWSRQRVCSSWRCDWNPEHCWINGTSLHHFAT